MKVRGRAARMVLLAGGGALGSLAVSHEAGAQLACSAGPLSAYLSSAGLGCTVGRLRLRNFATRGASALAADQVTISPFTLAGPPGYTWVGFSVRFATQVGSLSRATAGLSFWSEGAPLFGLMTNIAPGGQTLMVPGGTTIARNAVGGRLVGEQGVIRTWSSNPAGDVYACGRFGGGRERCIEGVSSLVGTILDTDQRYRVEATSYLRGGPTSDYTIAVLASSALVTPEPATLLLLSSGVAGVGAAVRRRRARQG